MVPALFGVFGHAGAPYFHQAFPDAESLFAGEDCKASGVLPFVVQLTGSLQVAEAYKLISNHDEVMSGRLLCCNFLTGKQRVLKVAASAALPAS